MIILNTHLTCSISCVNHRTCGGTVPFQTIYALWQRKAGSYSYEENDNLNAHVIDHTTIGGQLGTRLGLGTRLETSAHKDWGRVSKAVLTLLKHYQTETVWLQKCVCVYLKYNIKLAS